MSEGPYGDGLKSQNEEAVLENGEVYIRETSRHPGTQQAVYSIDTTRVTFTQTQGAELNGLLDV